jgi:hypothetical protein
MGLINKNADRRKFLKGITLGAGAVVLQPVLDGLAAQVAGEEGPRRVIFVVEGNGLDANHIQPRGLRRPQFGSDRLIDVSLAEHELPEAIAELTPFKNRMTIIQGLSSQVAAAGHSTNYGALGCYGASRGIQGPTIDCALSGSLPGIMPIVGLGVHSNPDTSVHYFVSASARGRPLPLQCKPELAFQSLFGSVAGGAAARTTDLRRSFLDYMASDIRRVRSELAGPERERLDTYLESYEAMRDRQVRLAGIQDRLRANMPRNPDRFGSRVETERLEAQFDLAAGAILSGITNCVTITSGGGEQDYITWRGLGIPIDGHQIGHNTGHDGRSPDQLRVIIRRFHARMIAGLASKLAAVREGNGTVLDRTLIVYLSDSGEQHHSFECHRWPVVLLGNLGGRLRTNGRFLEYPSYRRNGHRTLANLYLALLRAVGDRRETFGTSDLALRDINTAGPLEQILT